MKTIRVNDHAAPDTREHELAQRIAETGTGPRIYRTFCRAGHQSCQITTTSKEVHLRIGTWLPCTRELFCLLLICESESQFVVQIGQGPAWFITHGSGHDSDVYHIAPGH